MKILIFEDVCQVFEDPVRIFTRVPSPLLSLASKNVSLHKNIF